jgi:DNA-binding MarR family transcriptional regulator
MTRPLAEPRPILIGGSLHGGPKPTTTAPFAIEEHLFFWFTQVTARRDRQLAAALRPHALRVPEWRVLGALYSRRRLPMSTLADLAAVDPTTLSRTVERLVRAGLMVRLSDTTDLRVTRMALTAAGERKIVRILPLVAELNDMACAGLPEPMVGMVRWALREMRDNLDRSLAGERVRPPRRNGR